MTPYDRFTCYTSKKRGGLLRKTLGLRMGPAKVVIVGERGWGSASCIMNRGRGNEGDEQRCREEPNIRCQCSLAVYISWRVSVHGPPSLVISDVCELKSSLRS